MVKFTLIYLAVIILGNLNSVFTQGQEVEKCSVKKNIKGEYKILFETRPTGEPKKILLDLVIKPKNFNKEYMIDFAKRVRTVYCNEDYVSVNIYDSKKAVYGADYDYVTTGGKIDKRRGTYLLDKKAGKEAVEFSTKPSNSINEIRIEFPTIEKER